MPILAAFALANLKGDIGKLWSWLCHRSFWQLVSMGLAVFALVQHFQLADARHDADNYRRQRDGYKATLDGISARKNEQKTTTGKNIVIATRKAKEADGVAKKIEAAPIVPGCRTPPEITSADL
jgi:hypothetical protein